MTQTAKTADVVTEGDWFLEGPDMFGDYNVLHPSDALAVAAVVSNMRLADEVRGNTRLIVSACNSYQRHCPDPVSAAEGDLLGRCVEALRKAKRELENGNGEIMSIIAAMSHLDAILSQLHPTEGPRS